MREYFVYTNSFAAPFFSDSYTQFVEAESPEHAAALAVKKYKHPCGLFAAVVYESADAYHKGKSPLGQWLCNQELAKMEATKGKGSYSYCGHGPGKFEVDGKMFTVDDPKGGRYIPANPGKEDMP